MVRRRHTEIRRMSLLTVRNLWKSYGAQVVLEGVRLEIARGEFCTIVGASGCGKSTFLRILLGAEPPSRGEILLDGKPLPPEPDADRGIVFQRYSVYPHLTVLENVVLGLELAQARWLGRLYGARRRAAMQSALEMIEAVGLGAARDKYPAALSGGMQQRLAFAQSLVCKPKILLLDEPFGALDPGIRADMQSLALDLWRRQKLTVFMVTHDLPEAFGLGTRVLVFDRSKRELRAQSDDLKARAPGTRLLVFDKVRRDPQAPQAYGATITYDIPLNRKDRKASPSAERPAQ